MSTSKQLATSPYAVGAGRVDVAAATKATVTATGSADLGFYKWPYSSDGPVTRTLDYRNDGDQPVTLDLAPTGSHPAGVLTLADTSLTVPPHGTASTTLTGDGANAAVGTVSGQVTATDAATGTVVAHTAYAMTKEAERYDLTIHLKDRDGNPTGGVVELDQLVKGGLPGQTQVGDSGTVTFRLPPATYSADAWLNVRGSHGADSLGVGLLVDPTVVLDRDREITLDARTLHEVTAKVPNDVEDRQVDMRFARTLDGATMSSSYTVGRNIDSLFAAPVPTVADGTFTYQTDWRLTKPYLQVTAGGRSLADPWMQSGSTLIEGRTTLRLVDAGTGTPAELAAAKAAGAAALVHDTGDLTPVQLTANAEAAGVKALYVGDDAPGRMLQWFGEADKATHTAIQVAAVPLADEAVLRDAAARGADLHQTGTAFTPYVYDLTRTYSGGIPDGSLAYAPGPCDLARIDTDYRAPNGTPAIGAEIRYGITAAFPVALGGYIAQQLPGERTDWVTADPGVQWGESVLSDLDGSLEERGGLHAYTGGSQHDLSWFAPVLHAYSGGGLAFGQQRVRDTLTINIPGWGDSGPDHTGFGDYYHNPTMKQHTALYDAAGKLLNQTDSSTARFGTADPAEATYRVTTDTALDPAAWPLAATGHTEWTFRSAHTAATSYLPFINLDYDVATGPDGAVRAGRRLDVGISAAYITGATGAGTLGGGTLAYSTDDGATWHPVTLTGSGASWHGVIDVPKGAGYLSLKAGATDDKGGSVTQQTIRAVRIAG